MLGCLFRTVQAGRDARTSCCQPKKQTCPLPKSWPIKHTLLALLLSLPCPLGRAEVGFFFPAEAVIDKTQFGLIDVFDPVRLERILAWLRGKSFQISLDVGGVITRPAKPSGLRLEYRDQAGKTRIKAFRPGRQNGLRAFLPDPELRRRLAAFLDVMSRYPANVGAVFLADEPYVNGISKAEMERVGRLVRQELDVRGLRRVKLGVIFAAGMFDRGFAHMIDRQSAAYVADIDRQYAKGGRTAGFRQWVKRMRSDRLVTYDRAGNMYVEGGLPRGFDVFGADFYLSTLLLDRVHEQSLAWLATHYPGQGCAGFRGQSSAKIRARLSFFQDGLVRQGEQYRSEDRALLDAIFECRMGALTAMLQKAAPAGGSQLLMIAESSDNGLMEFSSAGKVKQGQPELLVEARVLDEVKRAQSFYAGHVCVYSAGLLFFTYQNEYDSAIKLHVGGAANMPSVLASIYQFAALPKPPCPASSR